ncbi:MAG TPA: uroporphyrinogen-III synthase [Caulobacter sp.]|nr:uroporphyrinogen-III synthase [Caulobacter sp.]
MTDAGPSVWITRARPGAEETAARVAARGFAPVVAPLLEARPVGEGPVDLAGIGALAFTSARGVEALAGRSPVRDLPVFTVGPATARAAREAGFARVVSGNGDVEALADLIADRAPRTGAILHAAAVQPAGDLVGDLVRRGVPARALAVYETVLADPSVILPDLPQLAAALVHSPRAARALAAFLADRPTPRLRLLALSPAVAQPLAGLKCDGIAVAPFPNDASLLNLL